MAPRESNSVGNAPRAAPDSAEIGKFSALAPRWWDPSGPMAPLHAINAARVRYVRDQMCAHAGRAPEGRTPLQGLRILDIGCGAGLLAEPLARLGATVTGVDASAEAVDAARAHAEGGGLSIDYRVGTAGDVAGTFDAVVTMEVVEHVPDLAAFVSEAVDRLADDGLFVAATINRTPKSYALAIIGAEYVLRWLPVGTHDWNRFVRPAELGKALRNAGVRVHDVAGVVFEASTGTFALSRDVDVNYVLAATR